MEDCEGMQIIHAKTVEQFYVFQNLLLNLPSDIKTIMLLWSQHNVRK